MQQLLQYAHILYAPNSQRWMDDSRRQNALMTALRCPIIVPQEKKGGSEKLFVKEGKLQKTKLTLKIDVGDVAHTRGWLAGQGHVRSVLW